MPTSTTAAKASTPFDEPRRPTNILLRLAEPDHPFHATTAAAVRQLRLAGHRPVILPQVVYEFWAVATRTLAANGLGMTAAAAESAIHDITLRMPVLRDERGVYDSWLALSKSYAVTGVNSHDMRIVAAMIRHGIPLLLTINSRDFRRYAEIEVVSPAEVVSPVQ